MILSNQKSEAAAWGNHIRWHVNRGVVKADCLFCNGFRGVTICIPCKDRHKETKQSVCEYCGITFWHRPDTNNRFCSWKCAGLAKRAPREKRICLYCETIFWVRPCENHRKFCSKTCYYKTRGLEPGKLTIEHDGYATVFWRQHPLANASMGVVRISRLVYWQEHGQDERTIELFRQGATVHHRNGKKDDDRIDNLELRIRGNHPHGVGEDDMIEILQTLGYKISRSEQS